MQGGAGLKWMFPELQMLSKLHIGREKDQWATGKVAQV